MRWYCQFVVGSRPWGDCLSGVEHRDVMGAWRASAFKGLTLRRPSWGSECRGSWAGWIIAQWRDCSVAQSADCGIGRACPVKCPDWGRRDQRLQISRLLGAGAGAGSGADPAAAFAASTDSIAGGGRRGARFGQDWRGKRRNRNTSSTSLGVRRSPTHGDQNRSKNGFKRGVRNTSFLKLNS